MTVLEIAKPLLTKSRVMQTARPACRARHPGRKKIFPSRKKIVDSAPVKLYVHITLPNCEHGTAAGGLKPQARKPLIASQRSPFMAPAKHRRAEARRLYEIDHLSTSAIAAQCGLTRATITRWARDEGWTRKADAPPADEPVDRRALVSRAWRNAERQLRIVEKRLRQHAQDDDSVPLDESARLIATLVKTLRELAALDRALAEQTDHHGSRAPHERSDIPRDLDAFYEELAARMDRLRQDRDSHGSAGGSSASLD